MGIEEKLQRGLADRLIQALQKDEFALYAQNIIAVTGDGGRQFQEIFVRFKEEDSKLLPPGAFFSVLQEHQLLPYLDRWVVNCLARWVRSGLMIKPDWEVPRSNVNLSDQTLLDAHYGAYVRKYVEGPYLAKGALAFEIRVESAYQYHDSLQHLIAMLRPYGCCFTLAAFDGNERSIEMLRAFAPDFVKIDYGCVTPEQLIELVRNCRMLRTKTIVEFVETPQALGVVRNAKADFVQGFGISPVQPL
jgi:EAL domain-containing protein (putative c-di-GMP-specific phosphodiesterase class I)